MAKVTTKRRAPREETLPPNDIFAHFEAHGRSLNDDQGTPVTSRQSGEDTSALLERIAKLEGTIEQQNRTSMMAAPAQAAPRATSTELKGVTFDPTGLPDPLHDIEAYNKELAVRMNAAIQANTEAVRRDLEGKQNQNSSAERLWKGFSEAHSEWAEYPELVESMAVKVTQEAIAKGIDPQKYMFQNTSLFYADVASALSDRFGRLVDSEDDAPKARRTDPNEDDGRAVATFGGQESGGRSPQRRSANNEGPGMIEDLQAIQKQMGIF